MDNKETITKRKRGSTTSQTKEGEDMISKLKSESGGLIEENNQKKC